MYGIYVILLSNILAELFICESLFFCRYIKIQLGQILDYFGPMSKGQTRLYTSRTDAYNLINTKVGSGRVTDSCILGLLVDLLFSEKFRECFCWKTPEQKKVL